MAPEIGPKSFGVSRNARQATTGEKGGVVSHVPGTEIKEKQWEKRGTRER